VLGKKTFIYRSSTIFAGNLKNLLMQELFTVDALISLLTLTVLEIVLGIDNVIFVSILMGRLNDKQKLSARRIWMFAGIGVRILLLLAGKKRKQRIIWI
jgi:predicted tellurium resistance membrane protein TerC